MSTIQKRYMGIGAAIERVAEELPAGYILSIDVEKGSDNDLREENKKLRHLLFMAHGSAEHYLYGDDGERTCNTCGIDFNTDSADEISRKIHEYNMRELARIHPEWLKLGDATVRDAQ